MDNILTPSHGRCSARLALTFSHGAEAAKGGAFDQSGRFDAEKLLRARDAVPRLAQLSIADRNSMLLAMADAVEGNAERILAANRSDLESCGLAGARQADYC
jgi:hypothetical protein